MIPEAKQDAVRRALSSAFDVETYSAIEPLGAGLSSALIFRIEVGGRAYLLRVITRIDAVADPTRMIACMEAAAAVGIAPKVWHASVEDRVLITDFVEAKPFPADMDLRMASVLRTLHALPPFPKIFTYLDVMDGFVQRSVAAKLLPENEVTEFSEGYARLKAAYPQCESDLVSCHNDLKPENLIFDGEKVWLVDWEGAFLNDRYCDLAVVANFYVEDEAAEKAYLDAYFGESAGEWRSAKFFLMRQWMSVIYAAYFLLLSAGLLKPVAGDVGFNGGMVLPAFREFHQRIVAGEMSLLDRKTQTEYGLVHFREALRWMRTERFAEALWVVGRL
jgi:aminoglycoside phosphotransferase (APT) family kinase protein